LYKDLLFFYCHSRFFCHTTFTVPFGRPFFQFIFLVPLPILSSGDATGALSLATHAHSTSHSQTYTTTFIHPWAPFPTGLEPVLTSRWWPKECVDSSFHHPTVSPEETYTHIHGSAEVSSFEKILPLRWDSNPLASGPRPRSTFSDSHAATYKDLLKYSYSSKSRFNGGR
jgi:hypothetical protein